MKEIDLILNIHRVSNYEELMKVNVNGREMKILKRFSTKFLGINLEFFL